MGLIKGIDVLLIGTTQTGVDDFNSPIFEEREITVKNVLVSPASTDDIGVPKGDNNVWENKEVIFFGERWKTIGIPQQGIEAMIPLNWNKKVMVERYE